MWLGRLSVNPEKDSAKVKEERVGGPTEVICKEKNPENWSVGLVAVCTARFPNFPLDVTTQENKFAQYERKLEPKLFFPGRE